jgi:hypothetical protein
MDNAEQRYLKNMPRPTKWPAFWTLTPPRLWSIAAAGGALAVGLSYLKMPQLQGRFDREVWEAYTLIFTVITVLVAFHINHVWAHIMDYNPEEIGEIPATRAQFALRRLPGALLMSFAPYLAFAILWYYGTQFYHLYKQDMKAVEAPRP